MYQQAAVDALTIRSGGDWRATPWDSVGTVALIKSPPLRTIETYCDESAMNFGERAFSRSFDSSGIHRPLVLYRGARRT
jgi:hypothetical protein